MIRFFCVIMLSYWEDNVYLVVAKDAEIPVYTIRPEVGSDRERRVHRNNIMSCNLVLPKQIEVKKKTQTRKRTTKNDENILAQSESDEEIIVVVHEDTSGNEEDEIVECVENIEKTVERNINEASDEESNLGDVEDELEKTYERPQRI